MKDVMRLQYRVLGDIEKAEMQTVKTIGLEFWEHLDELQKICGNGGWPDEDEARRCFAIAKTKVEEAVMWATKGVTA